MGGVSALTEDNAQDLLQHLRRAGYAASSLRQLAFVEVAIIASVVQDPEFCAEVTLPLCGHSFCLRCVRGFAAANGVNGRKELQRH